MRSQADLTLLRAPCRTSVVFSDTMGTESMVSLSIDERMARARSDLEHLLAEYQKPDCQMVSLRDAFYETLEKHCLQTFPVLPNECLGTLPDNRGAAWISPSNIIPKMRNLVVDGFSLLEVARACAVERQPGKVGDDMEAIDTSLLAY